MNKQSLLFISATCLFFGSMNVAMADACSTKQTDKGCEDKTSSSGYKYCECPAQDSWKGSGNITDGAEPSTGFGNNRPPNARVQGPK